ncbi:MAG TPA: AI-2E family transporter [Gaiellaceae bacterium]|nr:AI-2E family transporter [Gaiellaceae bacterium]
MAATEQPPERAAAGSDRDLTVRVAKATAAALAVGALAFGVWQVRSVLVLFLLALTFAAAIRPGVEWLRGHHVPEAVAILLHFLVVGGAIALLVWLAVPPALHQIGHALHGSAIVSPHTGPATGVRDRVLTWLQQHLRRLPSGTELLHPVATYSQKAGEAVVAIFFTLAATWYCVSERDAIIRLLTALAPESKRDTAREMYVAIDRRLGAYTRLRFLMVFAVGAALSAGFYVIGLNYWLLVGAFVGLIEIVPIIGPLIGSLLVLAVGLPQSLHVAGLALLWLVVVREFQNYVVNPHIGRSVGLSPLVTLLSVAVVGVLFGGLAVILAVPFTSAVATLVDVLVLGHDPPTEQPRRTFRVRRSE